jgi:nicotinate-nucleotide adenylyltransferase
VSVLRIGLFGGTFDPPHRAHEALARSATDALALDRLLWIPAGMPWQKTRAITDGEHRAAMVALAIAGEPRWQLERCELDRAGPSYMVDTVMALQAREPAAAWFLLIGQDQLARLHTWHRVEALMGLVTVAVAARPGPWPATDPRIAAAAVKTVPLPPIDLSATQLRERAARGETLDPWVAPAVARYIARHRLYATP